MKRYRRHLTVETDDLDELDHMNNVRYLHWVQVIAGEHWSRLTCPEWEAAYIWVVKSHHIEYFRPAFKGESLELETYVEQAHGAISRRIVHFRLSASQTPVATCKTQWCLLQKPDLKPARMPEAMKATFVSA